MSSGGRLVVLVLSLWLAQLSSTRTRRCWYTIPHAQRKEALACSLRSHLALRGGGGGGDVEPLPPEVPAEGCTTPGGLRRSMLSQSADLARRSWLSPRAASESKTKVSASAPRGESDGKDTTDGVQKAQDAEAAEDERRDVGTGGMRLKTTVVEPRQKHTATIIWLHGRGHDPDDLIRGDMPAVLALPWCKFIFVHSPRGSGSGMGAAGGAGEGQEGGEFIGAPSDRGGRWLPTDQSAIAEMDSLLRLINGVHRLIRQETSGDNGVPSQRLVLVGHGEVFRKIHEFDYHIDYFLKSHIAPITLFSSRAAWWLWLPLCHVVSL